MIAPGLSDLWATARALMAVPQADRPALMARLIAEAEQADAFRLHADRLHPALGDGSLMAAALARPRAARPVSDPAALAALALAALALRRHLKRGAVRQAQPDYLAPD